ncbi:hypothetical protein EEE87_09610, partial [Neisseria gonorrhoeae]
MSRNAVRKRQTEPSFPRKWESRTENLKKPFCPISSCTDRSRFPPAREWRVLGLRCIGNGGSGILLRPPRACKRRAHQ